MTEPTPSTPSRDSRAEPRTEALREAALALLDSTALTDPEDAWYSDPVFWRAFIDEDDARVFDDLDIAYLTLASPYNVLAALHGEAAALPGRAAPVTCPHDRDASEWRFDAATDSIWCPDCGRWRDDIMRERGYPAASEAAALAGLATRSAADAD